MVLIIIAWAFIERNIDRKNDWKCLSHRTCRPSKGKVTLSMTVTTSTAFYTWGEGVKFHWWNCGVASILQLQKRRFYWFGRSARCPDGELINDLLQSIPPRTWRWRNGGQLKTWAITLKTDLEILPPQQVFSYARWKKYWVNISTELVQARRAWMHLTSFFVIHDRAKIMFLGCIK